MLSRSVDLEKRIDVVVIIAPHRREKKTDWTKYQKALQSLLVLRSLIFFIILDSILSSLILLHHPCLWCINYYKALINRMHYLLDAIINIMHASICFMYLNIMHVSLCYMYHYVYNVYTWMWCMYHYVTCRNIMYIPIYDACITMLPVEI